ncbi:MAG TPA: hypothetical protein VF618_00560 [Thermoanaerobaculia bacterium]
MSDRRLAVGLFGLAFVAYAWFFGGAGWNQNANFNLTRALVEQQTIRIDGFPPNTGDFSFVDGKAYSNKPPGLSMLAAIPYALVFAFASDPAATMTQIVLLYWCTVATCATTGALLIATFFLYARRIGATQRTALAVSLTLAFGTYLFAYSTLFFAHVPSVFFLFLSFVLAQRRPLLSGAAAGMAVLCNYTVVIALPAVAALVLVLVQAAAADKPMGRMGRIGRWIAGGVPFALLLAAYHNAAFGSPFTTASETSNPMFTESHLWLGLFGVPKLPVLFELTFGAQRGLFFLSPVLLAAIAGAVVMLRRGLRIELAAIAWIVVAFLLVNASFNGWHGGSAIGPRYLLPIVPFLGVAMLFATPKLRTLWLALAVVSFAFNFVAVAVNPQPSQQIARPLDRYLFPLFVTGRLPDDVPPRPLTDWKVMLGHVSVMSQAPDETTPFTRHAPGSRESFWSSFNAGELLWPGSPLSTLPVLLWIVAGGIFMGRAAPGTPTFRRSRRAQSSGPASSGR